MNRDIIGVDINEVAIERCHEKINFEYDGANGKVAIHKGDARKLDFVASESIDLICTHPPYADMVKYSKDLELDIPEDLSNLGVSDFFNSNETSCIRVL